MARQPRILAEVYLLEKQGGRDDTGQVVAGHA